MEKLVVKILLLLFFPLASFAQYSIDTISKMKAWTSTYMEFSTPIYGTTSNGHIYHVAFVNHYLNGNLLSGLNFEVVRMDLTAHTITSKTINQPSATTALWINSMDSLGQVYIGFNTGGRRIWKFNFKDSIQVDSLGNGFSDGQSLAYSMSLGTDKHIYFGASSGSVSWCEYDPYNDTLYKHPEPDTHYQYVLDIAGDANYAYLKLGQNPDVRIFSVKKNDNQVKELFRVAGTGNANFIVRTDNTIDLGVASDTLTACYSLHDGIATQQSCRSSPGRNTYYEVNDPNKFPQPINVTSYIDEASKQLFYTVKRYGVITDAIDSVGTIPLEFVRNVIKHIFTFPNDEAHIYYVGDQYGIYYDYRVSEDSAYALGNDFYNIYSSLPANDSECYFGNYPSGALFLWNRNKSWTVGKQNSGAGSNSNPKLIGFFRTGTPAGFHHVNQLIYDKNKNVIGIGDVIRVNNTTSIAGYNPRTNEMFGYDYNKINNLGESSIAAWHDKILFATTGANCKIYVYNPSENTMVDSFSFGLGDCGKLYVSGDMLIGINSTTIYQYNLRSRKAVQVNTYTSITASVQLPDGRVVIEMNGTPPTSWNFIKIPYNYGSLFWLNNHLYALNGNYVIKINGVTSDDRYPINTPFNRFLYIKNKLGLYN